MKCPYCGELDDHVVDYRLVRDGLAIRRRRECQSCKKRFTTYEYIERSPLLIIKRNGNRENYQREKLLKGIRDACHKRVISADSIDNLVDDIEAEIFSLGMSEVPSIKIGVIVMDYLRKLDEVAYVRFASVYREFKDVEEFKEILVELNNLKQLEALREAQLPIVKEE